MRIDIDPRLEIDEELARQLRENRLPGPPRGRSRPPRRGPPVRWRRQRRGRRARLRGLAWRWLPGLMLLVLIWTLLRILVGG